MNLTEVSKFLSYVLRHRPDSIGISLDEAGWVSIDTLLVQCAAHERSLDRALLDEVVRTDSKSRYAISEDGLKIRANQGHSVEVDLGYEKAVPPVVLYHGTVEGSIKSIMAGGLKKMKRHHVHLSPDHETAVTVGARRGRPVVLQIDAKQMLDDGHQFFKSDNGVWLTDAVPARYLVRLGDVADQNR